jgi:hypothetical protein
MDDLEEAVNDVLDNGAAVDAGGEAHAQHPGVHKPGSMFDRHKQHEGDHGPQQPVGYTRDFEGGETRHGRVCHYAQISTGRAHRSIRS